MDYGDFLLGLLAVSTLTGLVTEAVKKLLRELGKNPPPNLLAGVPMTYGTPTLFMQKRAKPALSIFPAITNSQGGDPQHPGAAGNLRALSGACRGLYRRRLCGGSAGV